MDSLFFCTQRAYSGERGKFLDGESLPSSVPIWPAANWLEREVYDMFGIKV